MNYINTEGWNLPVILNFTVLTLFLAFSDDVQFFELKYTGIT